MSNALAAAADAPDITLGQAAAQTSPAAPPPPLKAPTKIAYGFGSVAFGVATLGLSSAVLQPYMNRVIGLPALWVGTAIMATLIFDAIIDPTIGRFSDNLRTRWGRRHPLMYLSAPLVAIACIAFWNAPASVGATQIGAYLVTMLVLLRLAVSLYEVPSSALAPELTPDYHQRTSLMSYRYFFGMLGGLTMNIVLYQVFLSPKAGGILNREGYAHYGILAAAVMMVSILISSLGTHRRIARLKHPPRPRQSLAESWREIVGTIANPSLVVVMLSGLTSGTATGMNSALSQYFYIELWGISAKQISLLSISGVFASILAVAAVAPISKAMGKKQAMMTLFFVAIFTGALPLTLKLANVLPPNDSPFIFIFLLADTFITTTTGIAGYILVASMVADVVEDSAIKTGVRSEGLLFAANGLLPKFTAGFGVFIAGVLLTTVNFPTHAAQGAVDPAIMRKLAMTYLPIAVTLQTLATAVLAFYRISKDSHQRNLDRLQESAALAEAADVEEAKPASVAAGGV